MLQNIVCCCYYYSLLTVIYREIREVSSFDSMSFNQKETQTPIFFVSPSIFFFSGRIRKVRAGEAKQETQSKHDFAIHVERSGRARVPAKRV